MIKSLILSICILAITTCLSQSKKEQLLYLNHIIDSISNIANCQKLQIDSINLIKSNLVKILELNKQEIAIKNSSIESLDLKVKNLELENENQKKHFESIASQLKDSLDLIFKKKISANTFHITDFAPENNGNINFDFQLNDFSEKKINGLFTSYWPDGWSKNKGDISTKSVYATGKYQKGLKNGYWKYTLCNGDIQYEGVYVNGLKHGVWTNYDFCNNVFKYTKFDSNGYLDMLLTIGEYYKIDLIGKISKEEILFEEGVPGDIFYYRDNSNNIIVKINYKTGQIFYDNNQPLVNQSFTFSYPFIIGKENKELVIYHKEGTIAFELINKNNYVEEHFYSKNGQLIAKCSFHHGLGKCEEYNDYGTLIHTYENEYGAGKYSGECACQ